MDAIALDTKTHELKIVEVTEPEIKSSDDVKLRVIQVGICGTDREEAAGDRGDSPAGTSRLIIGHEMIGQVVEVGDRVTTVEPGDYAIVTVRRGCGECKPCLANRADLCLTGRYKERGIKQLNGYQTETVVDKEQFVVKVPADIAHIGVLTEPMSVVEKAIDEAIRIQVARLPYNNDENRWMNGKEVLVAGLGPIGLLATLALRLRGANVIGLDILDANSARPQLCEAMGGRYVDGRQVQPDQLQEHFGQLDVIVEATGIAKLDFDLLGALGINGVFVLTGIPGGHRPVTVDGSSLMKNLVLKNQVMVGSVNASEQHFANAVRDLEEGAKKWGKVIPQFISNRIPRKQMHDALMHHLDNEIKTVIEWSDF